MSLALYETGDNIARTALQKMAHCQPPLFNCNYGYKDTNSSPAERPHHPSYLFLPTNPPKPLQRFLIDKSHEKSSSVVHQTVARKHRGVPSGIPFIYPASMICSLWTFRHRLLWGKIWGFHANVSEIKAFLCDKNREPRRDAKWLIQVT
jgi:hypothetical protein